MTPAYLHEKLIEACKNGTVADVKQWLDEGADPNFNINRPINALDIVIQRDKHDVVDLLLKHGAIIKEFVLQKAIEKDKNNLPRLLQNFQSCKDTTLLMGVLQAAINIDDVPLAKQAIIQGAKPEALFLSSIINLDSVEMLQTLIENGFNIHADKNMILTEWMGSPVIGGWGDKKHERHDLLTFVSEYYLDKPVSIEKFNSLRLPDKSLLFRIGLSSNNLTMMKFACLIGTDENDALNSALYRYYANNDESNSSIRSTMFKNHKGKTIDYEIIEYLLNSDMVFKKGTISNAVCFKYSDVLHALSHQQDLEYGYEVAYQHDDDMLCTYFNERGVSKKTQSFIKMKVSAIKGDVKTLRKAVNEDANIEDLTKDTIVEIINANQVVSLKYLHDAGLVFDSSFNAYLDKAMSYHKAYDAISYLIESGLNITSVKNLPEAYRKQYPTISHMWEKRFRDIFEYTIYLAREVHPNVDGRQKEEILQRIAELSTLPYVVKKSKEQLNEQ